MYKIYTKSTCTRTSINKILVSLDCDNHTTLARSISFSLNKWQSQISISKHNQLKLLHTNKHYKYWKPIFIQNKEKGSCAIWPQVDLKNNKYNVFEIYTKFGMF